LPGFRGLTFTIRRESPTIEQSGGREIGLSSIYSPPAMITVSFSPTVAVAIWQAFLIVLTGATAERPSFRSYPICSETYTRPPTSFVARFRTYSVVAILFDLSPCSGVIDLGNNPSPVWLYKGSDELFTL